MVTLLVILLSLFPKLHALSLPSNSSISPHLPSLSNLQFHPPPSILEDVIKAVVAKERWDPHGGIRVSRFDSRSSRIGVSHKYEFRVRSGETSLIFKFSDRIVSWKRPERDFGPDLVGFIPDSRPRPAIRDLELEGPLDVRVGGGDDELSLFLPSLNITHRGLRRILVGDGITIKLEGAEDVSLFHPYDIGLLQNRSLMEKNQDKSQFPQLGHPSCASIVSVRVAGAALVVASKTGVPEAYLESAVQSNDTIQLLPEKCYSNGYFQQARSCLFGSLSSELVLLEKILRSLLGSKILQGGRSRLLRAKINSSSLIKFRLELERSITENDRIWENVAEWRTKPVVERIWFEIVARVEEGKGLKLVLIRKLTRPIMAVESSPWSNLMSNISFTQFPFIVVPPEALTLDVKW